MVQTADSNMLRHRKVRGKARRADLDPRRQGSIVRRVPLVRSPQVCKFFKANRCERGKDCPWQHPATSKAAPAPKAEKTASGDTPKTSPRERKRRRRRVAGLLLKIRKIQRVLSPSSLRDRQKAAMLRCASSRRWCAPRPSTRSPRILACLV